MTRVEELPATEIERTSVAAIVEYARRQVDSAIDTLASLDPGTRRALWPHRSSDSCEPERDLRDALAHLDQVLVRHTAPETATAVVAG